jgi:hypothetical protein
MKIEGGCLCGQVRYHADVQPVFQATCHCKDCQKQGGTAYSVVIGVPEAALTLTGKTASYEHAGGSGGKVERVFCPRCGSPILTRAAAAPGMAIVKAGTLDDTTDLKPALHLWTESAMACTVIPEGVPAFPRNPG